MWKPEENGPHGPPRLRWEDNIKMDLKEAAWTALIWIRIVTGGGLLRMR